MAPGKSRFIPTAALLFLCACAADPSSTQESSGATDAETSASNTESGTPTGATSAGEGTSNGEGGSATTSGGVTTSADPTTDGGETTTTSGSTTSGTTGSTSSSGSSDEGSSSSTTGQQGQMLFPGDDCDPFIDTCLDVNDQDYECQLGYQWLGGNEYEWLFQCQWFKDDFGDGTELANCSPNADTNCSTGYWCKWKSEFAEGHCPHAKCCTAICTFGDQCAGGGECEIDFWQAQLADYLDQYTGLGICPEG